MKTSYTSSDYWAGAAELCGGVDKMASMAQLAEIANYIYNTTIIGAYDYFGQGQLTMDPNKALEFGLSSGATLWSNEERSQEGAYSRDIRSRATDWGNYARTNSTLLAVCIEE